MKDTPIIFCTELIPKILDGSKTQTRRVITNIKPNDPFQGGFPDVPTKYQVGDGLWVKETYFRYGRWAKNGWTKTGKQAWKFVATTDQVRYIDNPPEKLWDGWTREQLSERGHSDWHKRSSIFMPRWASRITLEITEVRVERVQEIQSSDITKEGIELGIDRYNQQHNSFVRLWNSLNAKRGQWRRWEDDDGKLHREFVRVDYSWEVNPIVRVISFRRL